MKTISILGAPSNLGLKPYDDDGAARDVVRAPAVLRDLGLVQRLHARDRGDVAAAPYRDFERPPGGIRNEALILEHAHRLAYVVDDAVHDHFLLLLGGDCSIILGALLGLRRRTKNLGLAFIDGHGDFNPAPVSQTGGAAGMDLALTVGRGSSPLARLSGNGPLVAEKNVVAIGRRDVADQEWLGEHAIGFSAIRDVPCNIVHAKGAESVAHDALAHLETLDGFFIHVDADVLDASIMYAVDTPEPDGLSVEQLAQLLRPLAHHPRALGLQLTIYDPRLDPDGACAARLVDVLQRALS